MEEQKEISVIIPVYNSRKCLKQTVDKTVSALLNLKVTYEIILIDDGSTDNTWGVIKELKTSYDIIKAVRFNKNYGQHNALLCGITVASGNYMVTMDDDMEQDPDDIGLLYEKIKSSNDDLIYGLPINIKKSLIRIVATKIYKSLSKGENKSAGDGSSFRIFNSELRKNLLQHTGSLFFLDEIVLWYTDKIGYERIKFNKSLKEESGYSFNRLFSLSLRVLSLSSTMPLKVVRTVGFYIYVISILLGIYFIIRKFILNVPLGFTAIIVTILFSTGVIAFSLGIIGEYLGNLISLSNNKPSYSIKEQI